MPATPCGTLRPRGPWKVFSLALLVLPQPAPGPGEHSFVLTEELRAAAETIEADDLRATVSFLASDELGGRDTPSPGLEEAARYLARRFEAAGLVPLKEGSGYLLPLDLEGRQLPRPGISGALDVNGELLELDAGAVALLRGGAADPQVVEDAPLLFVPSPEAIPMQLETRGVALLARLEAPSDASADAGRRLQYLSYLASRAGAAALVLVREPSESTAALLERAHEASFQSRLGDSRGSLPIPTVLVADAEISARLAEVLAAAGDPAAATEVPGSFTLDIPALEPVTVAVANVAGLLPGTDPGQEAVLVTAHYDHIGVQPGSTDDWICNGADDDASGTAAVVALADAFHALPGPPRRSIAFVCFAGEEKGLLGSTAFLRDPPIPAERLAAMVNFEMVGRPDDIGPDRAWVTGFELSGVGPALKEAAASLQVEIFRHEVHSAQLFRASDNFPFAQAGVPAHSLSAGSLHADYHQPSDEPDTLDYANMARVVRGAFLGVYHLAEADADPAWSETEAAAREFAQTRARTRDGAR